jgi:urease accessory protein
VALAGLVHGNAHGLEIPGTASGLGFAAGALVATAILHGAGAGLAALFARRPGLIAAFGAVTGLVGAAALVGAA